MKDQKNEFGFLICYNNSELYNNLRHSLGVSSEICTINNEKNTCTIPQAYNLMTQDSTMKYLVFIHQDIIVQPDWIEKLRWNIHTIEMKNINWGVIGIMGVKNNGFFAGNIIDPHTNCRYGTLPCEVQTLDEVCLIIRNNSGLVFDEDLGGYHFYGADICLQAKQKNMKCYAIDAPVMHLSGGTLNTSFWEMADKLKEKWSKVNNTPMTIETTCGVFRLSDSLLSIIEYNFKFLRRKIIRRIQKRHLKIS